MWRASTRRTDGVARLPIVEMGGHVTHEAVFSLKETQNPIIEAFSSAAKAFDLHARSQ
jgi:hypothetical protein